MRAKKKVDTLATLQRFLDNVAPDFTKRLKLAEDTARKSTEELEFMRGKLIGLLTPEQLEMAQFCKVAPEVYALNWIELQQEGEIGFAAQRGFPAHVRTLKELKAGVT